jgi:putative flippase GtrA
VSERALDASLARFVVVGGSNFAVSLAAFYGAFHYLPMGAAGGRAAFANVLAYAAGMINSFVLNRAWTFRVRGHVAVHALRFALLNAATLLGSTAIVFALVDTAGLPALAVWLPLTVVILLAHYLGMKHWAFEARS